MMMGLGSSHLETLYLVYRSLLQGHTVINSHKSRLIESNDNLGNDF